MEKFGGTEIAILLVTISNLLLVVILAFIAFRLYLAQASRRGEESENTPLSGEAAEATENPANTKGNVVLIDELLSEINTHSITPINDALHSSMQLVSDIHDVDSQQYPQWRHDHQAEIEKLLAQRQELEHQAHELKTKLERAHKLVTTLHQQNRQLNEQAGKLTILKQRHSRLTEDLRNLRAQRDTASHELEAAHKSLHKAKRELDSLREQQTLELEIKTKALNELREKSEALSQQLKLEQEVLSRTLVEKNFIEDAFVDTEAKLDELHALQREHEALKAAYSALSAEREKS